MKIRELKDLHQKSKAELEKMLEDWNKEMVEIRLKSKIGKIKDVNSLKNKRHDIARLKTIIHMKEEN